MAPDTVTIAVIACPTCGGPMNPDPARQAFFCPFCGHETPYSASAVTGARPLVFKHRPAEIHEGLLKLIRVAVLSGVHEDVAESNPMDPAVRWHRSFQSYVASIDRRAYITRRDRFAFSITCPHCGAPIQATSTQSMFECDYCGSIFGLDDLSDFGLDKLPQIVGNQSMVPSKCLPFKLNPRQAQARIRYLLSRFPDFFLPFDVDSMLRHNLLNAVYTPAALCDLALRTHTKSNLGTVEFYQEWVDWALPRDTGLDIALFERIAPWDFNEAGTFAPDLVLGDVVICAATNYASKLGIINSIAAQVAADSIVQRFGAQRLDLILWSHDLINHQSGLIALPVYFLEQLNENGDGMRIMVNGQSGAVSAVVRQSKRERYCDIPGSSDGRVDGERTMRSDPVPIKYEKPSHLYRVLSPQEAFGRKFKHMGGTAAQELGLR